MLINILGFVLPIEWVIAVSAIFGVFIFTIFFLVLTRGSNQGPIDKRLLLKVPVDEAGVIQRGKILGGIERTATDIFIKDPDYIDEEGNEYMQEASIENKIPFPCTDSEKSNVELWVGKEKDGVTEIVSASTLMGNVPTRYDPTPADPKKLFRPLMPWGSHGSVEELITNKNFWSIMIPTIIACLAVGHIL